MYRTLIPVLLFVSAVTAAPQDGNSDITYVKLEPVLDDGPAEPATKHRESRIENIPLTIPDNVKPSESDINPAESNQSVVNRSDTNRSDVKQSGNIWSNANLSESDLLDVSQSEGNRSDGNQSDTVLSESNQFDRYARSDSTSQYDSGETTETTEGVTEKSEEALEESEGNETLTKAPPSKVVPKLSYFQKSSRPGSYSKNFIEKASKRRFRSRCRCEKIWNCPKLQISVPRCPDEYFLCCF